MKKYNIIFRQYFSLYEDLRRFYRKFKTARQISYIIVLKQVQEKWIADEPNLQQKEN